MPAMASCCGAVMVASVLVLMYRVRGVYRIFTRRQPSYWSQFVSMGSKAFILFLAMLSVTIIDSILLSKANPKRFVIFV